MPACDCAKLTMRTISNDSAKSCSTTLESSCVWPVSSNARRAARSAPPGIAGSMPTLRMRPSSSVMGPASWSLVASNQPSSARSKVRALR